MNSGTPSSRDELGKKIMTAMEALREDDYAPQRVIVKFKESVSEQQRPGIAQAGGFEIMMELGRNTVLAKVEDVKRAVVDNFKNNPSIEFIEPDYYALPIDDYEIGATFSAEDPLLPEQWALKNDENGIDINILPAWEISKGRREVLVAIIDTGIDHNHSEFQDHQLWENRNETLNGQDDDGNGFIDDIHGWDFGDDDNNPYNDEDGKSSHGTGISSTVVAAHNESGMAGVAPGVTLMMLKTSPTNGAQARATTSAYVRAINYATMMGVDIINVSAGWAEQIVPEGLKDAVENTPALFVTSAGNIAGSIERDGYRKYPAGWNTANMISVANLTREGILLPPANDLPFQPGAAWGPNTVHIAAPGTDILMAKEKNQYRSGVGSSYAAPHVVGVAALIKSVRPDLNTLEIKDIILSTARYLPDLEDKLITKGMLDAGAALAMAMAVKPKRMA